MRHATTILLSLLFVLVPQIIWASSINELEARINLLEKENQRLKQQQDNLTQSINKTADDGSLAQEISIDLENQLRSQMKITGYADIEYKISTADGTHPGIRMHHFSLFFTKEVSDKWRLFSEIEYEDAPKIEGTGGTVTVDSGGGSVEVAEFKSSEGKIYLEAMNVDFLWSPQMKFRFGRMFTPAGIWLLDNKPPFVPTQLRPMHIRNIFPQVVDAVDVYGSFQLGNTFIKYDLYVGNGEGNSGAKDRNSTKAVGLLLSTQLPLFQYSEVGASLYQDTLNNSDDKNSIGIHAKINSGNLSAQFEYAKADITPLSSTSYSKVGYYGQLLYRYKTQAWGYRFDYFNDYDLISSREKDETRNGLFYNYRAHKNVVLKIEHYEVDPQFSKDYRESLASLVININD